MEFIVFDRCQALFRQEWAYDGTNLVVKTSKGQADAAAVPSDSYEVGDHEVQSMPGYGAELLSLPTQDENQRLMLVYGLLFTIRRFLEKAEGHSKEQSLISIPSFKSYSTSLYKIHYLEILSGYRFVLITYPGFPSLNSVLRYIWNNLFVSLVVLAPGFPARAPSQSLTSESERLQRQLFILRNTNFPAAVTRYLNSLPWFLKQFS